MGETVNGEATRIDYNSATQLLELTGRAEMRRLRNGQIADETMGHKIRYFGDDGKFFVVGQDDKKTGRTGRVTAVIAPRAATAATAAPNAGTAGTAANPPPPPAAAEK